MHTHTHTFNIINFITNNKFSFQGFFNYIKWSYIYIYKVLINK
jgi:hypothetical protein